jgi:epsilon-lactone hydrolase
MPSAQAIALSTFMRMLVKPSFSAMRNVIDMRNGAVKWLDSAARLEPDMQINAEKLSHCEAEWIGARGVKTDRVVLYIPGGAFVVRTPGMHRALAGRIARSAHARALIVFYRLAPEQPFPAGLEDCLEAYQRLLDDGIPPSRIIIGGDSAGGCLTLAVLLALRDRGRPLPAGAFAISPVTDLRNHKRGSRTRNQRADPLLSTLHSSRLNVHEVYVGGDKKLLANPLVSPLLGDFTGLPPLMFQVGSTEVLLDDSRLVVEKARDAGTEAHVEIWADMPHVWHGWPLPESKRAIAHLADFIRQRCP